MIQKTIIGIYGTANVGKSTTLRSLGSQLVSSGATTTDNMRTWEYRAVFNYLQTKLGLQTFGDHFTLVEEGLNHFLNNHCDLIVIATKRYGDTIDTVGAFAGDNGYRIIWIAPYEVRDGSIETQVIKDYSASHILLTINDIISDNL